MTKLMKLPLNKLYVGLLVGMFGSAAHAATFSVNTVLDTVDDIPGDGVAADSAGRTSLRSAVEEAVALGGSHSINFDSSLVASGDQTITLSEYDTGLDNGEFGPTSFILGNSTLLTINGPTGDNGISIERSATSNSDFRLFHIQAGSTLEMFNVALNNGAAIGGSSGSRTAGGGGAAGLGGAIVNEGTVTLEGVTLFGHMAMGGAGGNGGSASDGGAGGGGVAANGGQSSNNTGGTGGGPNGGNANGGAGGEYGGGGGGRGRSGAGSGSGATGGAGGLFGGAGGGGGSLCTGGGSGTCTGGNGGLGGFGGGGGGGGSVVSFNYTRNVGQGGAGGFGGGDGTNGRANRNSFQPSGDGGGGAAFGGAIFNYGGTLSVRNSTISGSTAAGGGSGGLDYYGNPGGPLADGGGGDGFGAAVFSMNKGSTAATVDMRHVTVSESIVVGGGSNNTPGSSNGAIYILGNAGDSSAILNNTIVANTTGGDDVSVNTISGGSATANGAGNLIENHTGFTGSVAVSANPDLAGLIDNRGPTPTHALNDSSPAIDAGDVSQIGGLTTDQRGGIFNRIVDGDLNGSTLVDIGAYELIQIDYGDAPDFASGTGDVEVLLENGNDDFRISFAGTNGDTSRSAYSPAVVLNETDNEFLVVWAADNEALDNEREIWGQRIDALTRTSVGNEFRISTMGVDGENTRSPSRPQAAWSSEDNQFLVVWSGDNEVIDNEQEIYARFVGPTNTLLGSQLTISQMGTGGTNDSASNVNLAYNSTNNEFLVAWHGDEAGTDGLVDNEFEIFAQRVSSTTLNPEGSRIQVSQTGGANGNTDFDAYSPNLSWNNATNEYFVVWHGDDNSNGTIDNEFEIFGRLVSGIGTPLGVSQTQLTSMGGVGSTDSRATDATVIYNPVENHYLLTYSGENALVSDGEYEVFAQFINSTTLAAIGPQIQISDAGLSGSTSFYAGNPFATYNPSTENYTIVFRAEEDTDNEGELYARRMDTAGNVIDTDEVRLTNMGPDGSTSFRAQSPAVAFNPITSDTFVVYYGDDDTAPLVDGEDEVFGQFVTDTLLVDYQSRGADDGAAHVRVAGMKLGALTDNDPDGIPSLDADGDDLDNLDDEDAIAAGVIEFASTSPVLTVNVTNNSGAAATLYGWIDYNADGVFDNSTERGMLAIPNATLDSDVALTLPTPPIDAALLTMARIRISSDPMSSDATGLVTGGEVEDYVAINIVDTVPNQFAFVDQTDVTLNTIIDSNSIEVTGINTPTTISVSDGSYSINGGQLQTASGTVVEGDMVMAHHTSSSAFSDAVDTVITIGGVSDTFSSATEAEDNTPDSFSFTDQSDVVLNTVVNSDPIEVTGVNTSVTVSVSGGSYSVNGGALQTDPGTVTEGDMVRAHHTSSLAFSDAVDTVITIGGISDTFTSVTEAEDSTPDGFSFTDQSDVALNTVLNSNPIEVIGVNTSVTVSVSGGSYSVNGGPLQTDPGTVTEGDMVRAHHTSSSAFSDDVDTVITIGGISDTFSSTTLAEDSTPDSFSFTDQSDVALNSVVNSDPIEVTGVNTSVTVSVSGGSYSVNGGPLQTAPGTVTEGDMVRAHHTSSTTFSEAVYTVITVGGISDTFSSTTLAEDNTPDTFSFTDQVDVEQSALITSEPIIVSGINSAANVSVSGGVYSVNNGPFVSVPGTVSSGDEVRVQHTSSAGYVTTTYTVLNIGGVIDTFTSTTISDVIFMNGFEQ